MLPLVCVLLICELLVLLLGIRIDKYCSVLDGIWDIRWIICNTVIIPLIVNNIQHEAKRSNDLKKQFSVYKDLMIETEGFVSDLCMVIGLDGFEGDLLSETGLDSMIGFVLSNKSKTITDDTVFKTRSGYGHAVDRTTYLDIVFSLYIRQIESVHAIVLQSDFIGPMDRFNRQINEVKLLLVEERTIISKEGFNYTNDKIIGFIDMFLRYIYPAIAYIRKPWRWDIDRNNRIIEVLKRDGNN